MQFILSGVFFPLPSGRSQEDDASEWETLTCFLFLLLRDFYKKILFPQWQMARYISISISGRKCCVGWQTNHWVALLDSDLDHFCSVAPLPQCCWFPSCFVSISSIFLLHVYGFIHSMHPKDKSVLTKPRLHLRFTEFLLSENWNQP